MRQAIRKVAGGPFQRFHAISFHFMVRIMVRVRVRVSAHFFLKIVIIRVGGNLCALVLVVSTPR